MANSKWKLVPEKATQEMIKPALNCIRPGLIPDNEIIGAINVALSAAPIRSRACGLNWN